MRTTWKESTKMVKGSEIGVLGAALRGSHGISAESEVLRLSS